MLFDVIHDITFYLPVDFGQVSQFLQVSLQTLQSCELPILLAPLLQSCLGVLQLELEVVYHLVRRHLREEMWLHAPILENDANKFGY